MTIKQIYILLSLPTAKNQTLNELEDRSSLKVNLFYIWDQSDLPLYIYNIIYIVLFVNICMLELSYLFPAWQNDKYNSSVQFVLSRVVLFEHKYPPPLFLIDDEQHTGFFRTISKAQQFL